MKILLTDDHILFREGLCSLIENQSDFTIVGVAATIQDTITKAKQLQPDIILMDFHLPDGTGLDATCAILRHNPQTKIILLTMNEAEEALSEAIRCGAYGYLPKNVPVSELLAYIRGFGQGESELSPVNTNPQ